MTELDSAFQVSTQPAQNLFAWHKKPSFSFPEALSDRLPQSLFVVLGVTITLGEKPESLADHLTRIAVQTGVHFFLNHALKFGGQFDIHRLIVGQGKGPVNSSLPHVLKGKIELPKFTPDKPRLLQTRFEKWLYTLKFSDLYHNRELPDNLKEEGIEMAIDAMRKAYAQDEIRAVIEAQEKAKRDQISRLSFAERKGREEAHQDVARRMLARGADRAFIMEVTELSEKELAALEKELEAKQGS